MLNVPTLTSIGKYCFRQNMQMQIINPWICADFSGLISLKSLHPDGSIQGEYTAKDLPFLHVAAVGDRQHFIYDDRREDWVLIFAPDSFTRDPMTNQIYYKSDANLFPVKRFLKLNQEEVPSLRQEFERIKMLHMSGTPPDRAAAELLSAAILARFLIETPDERHRVEDTPAERFRASLDADTAWQESIEEHSRRCGYSRDRMRILFQKRFGLTPGEYRTRKRLDFLLHEIIYTNQPLKEIANRAGLRHVQHLYAIFKENNMETPKTLCMRYREGK